MRNAAKLTDTILKAVEKVARNEVEKNVLGGAPKCSAIYHQPKRPKKTK